MRCHSLAAFALIASTGIAAAQEAREHISTPADFVRTAGASEPAQRDRPRSASGFAGVDLRQATVADVDLNGDGYISFDELLRFDVTKDF